jgi:hypothetical protein
MTATPQHQREAVMTENTGMNKDNWVQLFKEAGLTEAMMEKWHSLYEKTYPESHQSFLEWLGLPDSRIAEIRKRYSR